MRAPPAKRPKAAPDELATALAWLGSYPKASRWMGRHDLASLLDAGGGLAVLPDFLPPHVAEGALRILEAVPQQRWTDTSAHQDYSANNISHAFWSTKAASGGGGGNALQTLLRAFTLLLPEQLHAFSAARYEQGHHIAPHDDRAYTPVQLESGEMVSCSREIAVIYYLTRGWEQGMGGCLLDLEAPGGPRTIVPAFNSLVTFRIPRYHEVTPLTTSRPRYSVFGWFLQPGKLYELFTGEQQQQQQRHKQQQQQQQQDEEQEGRQKQKRRRKLQAALPQEAAAAEANTAPELHCKLARRILAKAAACKAG